MRNDVGIGLIGVGIGAGLMFLMDPNMGRRRRALLRDKGVKLMNNTSLAVDKTSRDTKNRIRGLVVTFKGGGQSRPGHRVAVLQRNWPPAVRLLAGTTGAIVTLAGIAKGGRLGALVGGIGTSITAMAITNLSIRDLIDRESRRDVDATAQERNTGASVSGEYDDRR